MNINFGKYEGQSVAEVILKHPDYVKWVLENNNAKGELLIVRNEMNRLIGIFDSKPFISKCMCSNCNNTATRCTAYKEDYSGPYWWCENCDPYQTGASTGTLHVIRSYQDALYYVTDICKERKEDYVGLIKKLAEGKGLKKRATKNDIEKYFLPEGILTF